MKKNYFIFCLIIIMAFISIGCSSQEEKYVPMIRWNDTNYCILPNTLVKKEDIGEQLNTVKKTVKKFPKENCEANNNIKVGTKFFRIKNEIITDAIAMGKNGYYLKAINKKK